MALFHIPRYWCDEGKEEKAEDRKAILLQELQQQAHQRYQQSSEHKVNGDISTQLSKLSVNSTSKRNKRAEYSSDGDKTDPDDKGQRKKKKKKQKVSEKSVVDKDGDKNHQQTKKSSKDVSARSTGFTVLNDQTEFNRQQRVDSIAAADFSLPNWLAAGSQLSSVLGDSDQNRGLDYIPELDQNLLELLKTNGITYFFPVQREVIPFVLQQNLMRCPEFFRPNDICVSSPTGSGKTLSYVLPIIQCIQNARHSAHSMRALVVLPVVSLARQVYSVFIIYTSGSTLRVLLLSGEQSLASEQEELRRHRGRVDIIVATPGRLVDHLERSRQWVNVDLLQYLVMDEADRMMEDVKQEWLAQLEDLIYRRRPQLKAPLTAATSLTPIVPLQKLLFSATLSQNPEQIQKLRLFQPKLFVCLSKSGDAAASGGKTQGEGAGVTAVAPSVGSISKYRVPESLSEYFLVCKPAEKPALILYLVMALKLRPLLCFSNKIDSTHRMKLLLGQVPDLTVRELSSKTKKSQQAKIVEEARRGHVDVLISTDTLARGMDMDGVRCVVSYERPKYVRTYIHRVGRTARAGRTGTAVTFMDKREVRHFKQLLLAETGRTFVREMRVRRNQLGKYQEVCKLALEKVSGND